MAKTRKLRRPRPGIYEDVPFAQYQSWPFVNNSSLGPALRSGRHYLASLDQERSKPTAQMVLGSMVHAMVLEPGEAVAERFAVLPDFTDEVKFKYRAPERSSEYKGLAQRWQREQKGKTIVSAESYDTARSCADAVLAVFGDHITAGRAELSVVSALVDEQVTVSPAAKHIRIKARLDLLTDFGIIDLKTTHNAGEFEQEIERYGYHRQAAFYQDILAPHVGGKLLPVWLVAVETSAPWLVRVAPLDESAIDQGRAETTLAIRRISKGLTDGKWEGYPPVARWRLPKDSHVVDLQVHHQEIEVRG